MTQLWIACWILVCIAGGALGVALRANRRIDELQAYVTALAEEVGEMDEGQERYDAILVEHTNQLDTLDRDVEEIDLRLGRLLAARFAGGPQ